jgi:hypothetical protein
MISWGVEVNDYGNAILDEAGNFSKVKDKGMTEAMWEEMVAHAESKGLKKGDYKKLNLPFENKLMGLPAEVRERMVQDVEDFTYHMMAKVLNAKGTARLAVEAILEAGSYDVGPKATRIEDPAEWTEAKIREKAKAISSDKGPAGDFDD